MPLLLAGVFLLLALARTGGGPGVAAWHHDERVEMASATDRRAQATEGERAQRSDARSGSDPSRDAEDESSSRLVCDAGEDGELDADEDDVGVPWTRTEALAIHGHASLAATRTRSPPGPAAPIAPPQRPPSA